MTTFERVRELVCNQAGVDAVQLDTELEKDLNFDSLDAVELAMDLEEEFEITVSDPLMEKCKTVEDIVKAIDKELEND